MNRPTTLATIFTIALVLSGMLAPIAHAQDAATVAQDAAMGITRVVNEATILRRELGGDAHAKAGDLLTKLGILRSELQTLGTDLADRDSKITVLEERVEWLRLYVESAIEKHNRELVPLQVEARRLNAWDASLASRIAAHNRERDRPRTREQMIAYDDKARRLNDERDRLDTAWAALHTREARDIEPLRLEISKRKRAHHLKVAETKRAIIAYNKLVATMNGKIDRAQGYVNRLAAIFDAAAQQKQP